MHLNLRRLAFGAAAFALTAGTTVLIGAGSASAGSGPNGPAINCTFGAPVLVTFPAPGLSALGSLGASKVTVTTTASVSLSCGVGGTGTFPAQNISTKASVKCKGKVTDPAPCDGLADDKGMYVYDSTAGFATSTGSIVKSLKKLSLNLTGTAPAPPTGTGGPVALSIKNSTASDLAPGNICSASPAEVGFQISGSLKGPKSPTNYKGGTSTLNACLLGDSGPGTTGNFAADLGAPGVTIATATLDPATSSVNFTS